MTMIKGTSGNDTINGTSLADLIYGYDGNDIILAGAGADSMYGGRGNDTYYVDNTGDTVTENTSEGTDTVISTISYVLGSNIENLTLAGSGNISATGNSLNNYIKGNSGNNLIKGGSGADTMVGGAGNDIYYVENIGDVVTEYSNQGTDTVNSGISYILGNNVENLTLTGTTNINGTGNSLNNLIYGSCGNNMIDGKTGADRMIGGAGSDTYYVDSLGDVITENDGYGYDSVISTVSYALSSNVENLTLSGTGNINGIGNSIDNYIVGNSGNNIIDGGAGWDELAGGTGNDIYYVDSFDDIVIEYEGEGYDTVYSSASYEMTFYDLENLYLTGTDDIFAVGNGLNNHIKGNIGNNTLDGYGNTDTLEGGQGNDLYYIDDSDDTIIENVAEGTDTVSTSVSYKLGNNLENLILDEWGDINGTGNIYDNSIIGNSSNNILNAEAGADTLSGGAGADTLYGGSGRDTYLFNPGDGIDLICDVEGTADKVLLGPDISKENIVFYFNNNDLEIGYNDPNYYEYANMTDYIVVQNQKLDTNSIEKFQLNDNTYLSSSDINSVIQQMSTFAAFNGIELTSINDVRNNQDLLNIVVSAWHS